VLLLLFRPTPAPAQATTGSIAGRVLDQTGALMPGVTVQALNASTGLVESSKTNPVGEYTLPALPPGTYTLSASQPGFITFTRSDVHLAIDQKLQVDFGLLLTRTDYIPVIERDQLLQTQSAETGEVIDSRQILDLPLLGRNFLDLARLTYGVTSGASGNTLNLSVNGQREFANSVLLDGIEITANRNNDTALRPSVDSVEEFKVLTSAYNAEFGRASGAVIAVQTKSGTNQLHGDLYEFFRPGATAARTFFATERSPLKQHNFGGTLGGPIRMDKTFWFLSYEGVRQRDVFSYLDSVPPSSQIRYTAGGVDLSGLKDPLTGNMIPIFDPNVYAAYYYAAPFPGNVIPANRVNSAGKAVLQNFFPAPTATGILNGWFSNFNSRQAYAFDSDTLSGRVDHSLSAASRLSAAYHYGSFYSLSGDRFAGSIPVSGGGDADYSDHENSRNQSLSIADTHLISTRLLNEFRFGYTRFRLDQLSLLNGQNLAAQFGQPNVNLPAYPQTLGFPDVYLGFGAQTGGSTYKPLHFLDSNYQVGDQVSGRAGRHEWRAGAEFRFLHSAPFFSLFPTGFQYYGGPGLSLTSDPNYGFYDPAAFYYNGGSDIADLLLGLPYTVNLGLQTTNPHTPSWESGFFLQDTWRVADRLVLSFGLRYEYFAPWTETGNQAANVDSTTGQILLAGRGGNSASLVNPDHNNFAPRAGLAYRLGASMVLRAGWGIFYSPENDAREDVLTKNYPFAVSQTFFNDIYGGLPFAYNLDTGVARIVPTVPSGVSSISPAAVKAGTGTAQNLFLVDPSLRTAYSQLYNFMLQREFGSAMTVEAGYVGSESRKLPYAVGDVNRGGRITPSLGQIQAQFSEGSASFNSLQVKATRRLSKNLSFLTAYTFGKNIDNGPAPFNLGHNLNSHNQPQDPFHLSLERAVADNDIAHNLVASFLYTLPWRRPAGLRGFLSGWQLAGIFVHRSGLPVNVVRNPQDAAYPGLRPDLVADPNLLAAGPTLAQYFNTKAFSTARFTGANKHAVGTAGRNLVRGPGLTNLDFSVLKDQALREHLAVQLRFEFFNLTNTPHFANPIGDMTNGSFGSVTQTVANPRIVQFGAKVKW
jgi:hypothetical protein